MNEILPALIYIDVCINIDVGELRMGIYCRSQPVYALKLVRVREVTSELLHNYTGYGIYTV